jgi:hypothetical protein
MIEYLKNISRDDLEKKYDELVQENYRLGILNAELTYQAERKWWQFWLPKSIGGLIEKVDNRKPPYKAAQSDAQIEKELRHGH